MSKFRNYIFCALQALAIYTCVFFLVFETVMPEDFPLAAFLIGAFAVLTLSAELKRDWIILAVWLFAAAAFGIIFHAELKDAAAGFFNLIIDAFKKAYPKIYDVYEVKNDKDIFYFLTEFSVILSIMCVRAVKGRYCAFFAAVCAAFTAAAAVFMPVLSTKWFIVYALLCMFSLSYAVITKKRKRDADAAGITLCVWVRSAAVLLTAIIVFAGIFGIKKPACIDNLKDEAGLAFDNLRYGSTESTGLTQGDLANAAEKPREDKTMMKVTMSNPASCYLRGFVGETYEDSRFKPLSEDKLYDGADIFVKLHENGFFAQTQLSFAAHASGCDFSESENTMHVENIALPSKYIYSPYEALYDKEIIDSKQIGDSVIKAEGFNGKRSYDLTAGGDYVLNYGKIAEALFNDISDENVKNYFKLEAAYNCFVYENYTDIPQDIDKYLSEKLGSYVKREDESHFDYNYAKQNILYYLTENVTYDENVEKTGEGIDFILNFLDGTKRGYDVHYAAAAVMMFRYYGIPSRFAEGYIITIPEAEKMKSGQSVSLDSTHAHAWAEYYMDGIGWLPFEATPTYLSLLKQPDIYKDISGFIGQTTEEDITDALQPDSVNEEENPMLLAFWIKNRLTIVLALAVGFLLFLIAAFITWIIRERKKANEKKALFMSQDLRTAICCAFKYITDIMIAGGLKTDNRPAEDYAEYIDADLRESYINVVKIWQEAYFSSNALSEEKRNDVIALKDEMWKRIWESSGLIKKIKLKYMYFL